MLRDDGSDRGGRQALVAAGRAGLSGVRGRVARRASAPIAARTGLSREQVEALMGGALLLLATVQFALLVRRAVLAGIRDAAATS